MKPTIIRQEILLFTESKFSSREFSSTEKENNRTGSPIEELEKACWAGMLWEMLPELMGIHTCKNLFIWQITNGLHFLKINMGSYACEVERETTLDPYYFMVAMNEN